jgi:hypothetical protein
MLKKLNTSSDKVLEYQVEGEVSAEEMRTALRELKTVVEEQGNINILVRAKDISESEYMKVVKDFVSDKEYFDKVNKYALVTDSKALATVEKLSGVLADLEYESFPLDKEEEARQWVR